MNNEVDLESLIQQKDSYSAIRAIKEGLWATEIGDILYTHEDELGKKKSDMLRDLRDYLERVAWEKIDKALPSWVEVKK